GAEFNEIDASATPELRAEMQERSGRNTFPQIFIGSVHVGGCDDLYALEDEGKLESLLKTGKLI
ncbi:glutaredoxin domain-containing protein, partial [Brucella canis]